MRLPIHGSIRQYILDSFSCYRIVRYIRERKSGKALEFLHKTGGAAHDQE
jgi:hypothetical protein